YPAGKKIKLEGIDEPMTAYENQVRFIADLEVSADAVGKQEELTFEAKYQACNDDQCLRPTTLKLVVPIAVARPGEAVKPANEKVFAGDGKKK
ncbi:MAG: hypothetical protein HZA46_23005, partial [Planctomycetales bacterium]|nr:hypothetical protein [Planctomycetales bacterium]